MLDDGESGLSQLPTRKEQWVPPNHTPGVNSSACVSLSPSTCGSMNSKPNYRHVDYFKILTDNSDAMPEWELCYKSISLMSTPAKFLNILFCLFETPVCEHVKSEWVIVKSQCGIKNSKTFQTNCVFTLIERSLCISIFQNLFQLH